MSDVSSSAPRTSGDAAALDAATPDAATLCAATLNAATPSAATLDVAIIGAGASGLAMAIALKKAGIARFTIFEKSDGVGGTWRDHTYPGADCDVPSHLYSFSFAPNPDWSGIFSPQPEILAYFEERAKRFGLLPHCRFRTELESAAFDEADDVWRIRTEEGEEFAAEVLVSGIGQLSRPMAPPLPGLGAFRGKAFHSARWDHAYGLRGKRVAVIGNGASAVQFVPHVAAAAAKMTLFQRSNNWITSRIDREYAGRRGVRLKDAWKQGAEAYYGVAVSGFRNFFLLYGPRTNLGHNSILSMVETQVRYVMACLGEMRAKKPRWLDVKRAAMADYNRALQKDLGETVWAAGCSNWYKNESGRITNNWSGFTLRYRWRMRNPDFNAFEAAASAATTAQGARR